MTHLKQGDKPKIEWNVDEMAQFKKRLMGKSYPKSYFLDVVVSSLVLELRLKSKLTQKQLARKCKTKQPAIARLENNGKASLSFLEKIGKACGYQLKVYFEHL